MAESARVTSPPTALETVEPKLAAAIASWLRFLGSERQNSPHTIAAYAGDLHQFLGFIGEFHGALPSLELIITTSPADVRSYLAHLRQSGRGAASLARKLASLRNFAHHLKRQNIAAIEAFAIIRTPKKPRRGPRPLSESEAAEALAEIGGLARLPWLGRRDTALLMLLYGSGLRISEALGLNGRDWISLTAATSDGHLQVIGKRNKARRIPILPVVVNAIQAYVAICPYALTADQPLFRGARGERLNPGVVQRQMRLLRAALQLPESATPHALRHSFASHLLANGGELVAIKDLLGHSALSSTEIYTHIAPQRLIEIHAKTHPRAK